MAEIEKKKNLPIETWRISLGCYAQTSRILSLVTRFDQRRFHRCSPCLRFAKRKLIVISYKDKKSLTPPPLV